MAKGRKIDVGALQGIHLHDGFLGEETLLRLIQHDNYKTSGQVLVNEKLRSFRNNYQEFSRNCERLSKKNQLTKLQPLISEWIKTNVGYFGYSDFELTTEQHWEEGKLTFLAPKNDSHSVAIFFSCHPESLTATIHDCVPLTAANGEVLSASSRKETLCEQVEKAINQVGVGEALLFTPNAVYYFRADSQVSGQCLECRWDEMLLGDNDHALALATFLLRSEFFSFTNASEEQIATEDEGDDTDGEDEEEDAGSTNSSAKLTPSSELFKENLDQAREITEDLHKQVVLALELLTNERLAIDPELKKSALKAKTNETVAQNLFKDGLFVLYRILFVLYAESRGFLPVENRRFGSFYSLEHLRDWSEDFLRKRNRGIGNPEGTYVWGALKSIFTLLRRGVNLPGGELVSPYNGQLFAPDRAPYFDKGPLLRDEAMANMITALTRVGGLASARRLHFANLGVEQLGAVYEALLAQKPIIVREDSLWVPSHAGGIGLVTNELATTLQMETFDADEPAAGSKRKRRQKSAGELEKGIDPKRPAFRPSIGKFIVAPLGGQKRQTASFYTPPKLAEYLVRRTLGPLAEGRSSKEILNLRVLEPAMGSGSFLIQVVRYLGQQLLLARVRERAIELRGQEKPTFKDLQRCKREIVESCIFGVDINPLAIELARTSLYLEALVPAEPLPFLHHRLKAGNSLIGADFQNRARSSWEPGVDFPLLFDVPFEHLSLDDKLSKAWASAFGEKVDVAALKAEISQLKKRLRTERKRLGGGTWAAWATGAQAKLNHVLGLAKNAQEAFEKAQVSDSVIERMETRHKDILSLIPDMDSILIEAHGLEIDEGLLARRKRALLTEYGTIQYEAMVASQRCFTRLKALGDFHTALWYWPLTELDLYPSFEEFRQIYDWLLDIQSLKPKAKPRALQRRLVEILKTAIRVGKKHGFFHWQLEFANVFVDSNRLGFDSVISNPPWKQVWIKDKLFYPQIDPQFLSEKKGRKQRIAKIHEILPQTRREWYDESFLINRMSNHWRLGALSSSAPEGKLDLSSLFTLRSETIGRQGVRVGLIVSRFAVFTSRYTRNIRRHLFEAWNLRESYSFSNHLSLFAISTGMEFSLLIGEPNSKVSGEPTFIHGLVDPASLPSIALQLDRPKAVSSIRSHFFPVKLSSNVIERVFSKDNFSIPGITHPNQITIAEALHSAGGRVAYLGNLEAVVRHGINQTEGPENGLSIDAKDLPRNAGFSIEKVVKGKNLSWAPLYKGRMFHHFDPFYNGESDWEFSQFGNREKLEENGISMSKKSLVWRAVTLGNQRSLIVSILPEGCWADNNVWCIQLREENLLFHLEVIFGSLQLDFLVKLVGGLNINKGLVAALPIANYRTHAIDEAAKIAASIYDERIASFISSGRPPGPDPMHRKKTAAIDALMWIHYGRNSSVLDRNLFEWMLGTQFPKLNEADPEYKHLVLQAFDKYAKDARFTSGKIGELFKTTEAATIVPLEERRVIQRRGERNKQNDLLLPNEQSANERRIGERRKG